MISFVVPAYNEEKYLGATLESIHAAARAVGEPYEVVVANDASSDATVAIAEAGGARVVSVEKRQIAATRNAGARASTGEILIFVDADTRIDAAVVRAALAALRSGAVGGGAGVRLDEAPRWAHILMVALFAIGRWLRLAAGCFVYCTREAFDAVGGFDETYFGAEELVLSRALGRVGRFVVLRQAVTTSGRKIHGRSAWQMFKIIARLFLRGPQGVRRREGMDFWYEDRR
jgi:glycosyltransferase involved in cell wall biosynthesis